ncbi:MAG: glycoside hydrolase family 32 protein [Actinomycetota bacterium]|nr:glycoside hydrolase family 32 protein [Actinomycetota bacterium]
MSERHRPRLHLSATTGWINDPNAPVRVGDTYHLFAQHNPASTVHGDICWLHWSSTDLVTWTERPVALTPRPDGPDAAGCWSGSAVLVGGEPWLLYSGYRSDAMHQSVCLARPAPDGVTWIAGRAPVVATPPQEVTMFRDPYGWGSEGDYRMVIGAGLPEGAPCCLLMTSPDLVDWTPRGLLLTGTDPVFSGQWVGEGWECPSLVPLGDRWLLVMSAWSPDRLDHVAFTVGDIVGDRLVAQRAGRLDHGPDFYAATTMADGDRVLMWAWSWEARSQADVAADGWAGVLTAPRALSLGSDGRLIQYPAAELLGLRGAGRESLGLRLLDCERLLDARAGAHLDLEVRLSVPPGGRAWVRLLTDALATEATLITYDAGAGEVSLDRNHSSRRAGTLGGRYAVPVTEDADGGVELRVLVDGSIVELFVAGACLTARVYPDGEDSIGLVVGAEGEAARVDVRWWPLLLIR